MILSVQVSREVRTAPDDTVILHIFKLNIFSFSDNTVDVKGTVQNRETHSVSLVHFAFKSFQNCMLDLLQNIKNIVLCLSKT